MCFVGVHITTNAFFPLARVTGLFGLEASSDTILTSIEHVPALP